MSTTTSKNRTTANRTTANRTNAVTLWSRPAWDTERWLRDFFGPAAVADWARPTADGLSPAAEVVKDGDDAVPIGRRQLLRRIDDAIRNGQIALFAALQQYFIVSPAALLSLVFRTQKSV